MDFFETDVSGLFYIKSEPFEDDRGSFARVFCAEEFAQNVSGNPICQANLSKNPKAFTLRGFHYQLPPQGEDKLLRCETGSIFDVAIDLRPTSPTYLKWYGKMLSSEASDMLWVPKGCAHAFLTLEPKTNVSYLVSEFYQPALERGICYNDPHFNVAWPFEPQVMSEKDINWPAFSLVAHEQEWSS